MTLNELMLILCLALMLVTKAAVSRALKMATYGWPVCCICFETIFPTDVGLPRLNPCTERVLAHAMGLIICCSSHC